MSYEWSLLEDSAGLTDVNGFFAGSCAADIRQTQSERKDLAVVYSREKCAVAATFTTHDLPAAPIRVSQDLMNQNEDLHGFIVNSGNANACTGEKGLQDAWDMIRCACEACELPASSMLVCSTGRIGRALPMPHVLRGIEKAAKNAGDQAENGKDAADAIMTSDTKRKTVSASIRFEQGTVHMTGMAKGAGMIQPDMATMLAFVTTDADLDPIVAQKALNRAVKTSFNAITIDGDMSTNDTVILLANGTSDITIEEENDGFTAFTEALTALCENLAKKMVKDGERVTKCVEIFIKNAENEQGAERVARAIGNSLLVKTSWYGNDPNWGRILDAAGYAGAGIQENRIDLWYDDIPVLQKGIPLQEKLEDWKAIVKQSEFRITLSLNQGDEHYRLLTTDLTQGYVEFNKSE